MTQESGFPPHFAEQKLTEKGTWKDVSAVLAESGVGRIWARGRVIVSIRFCLIR